MILRIINIDKNSNHDEQFPINDILSIIPKISKQYMICNYDTHGQFRVYKLKDNVQSFDFSNYEEFNPEIFIGDDREYFTETKYGKVKYLNCIEAKKNIFKDTIILTILFESDEVYIDDEPLNLGGTS